MRNGPAASSAPDGAAGRFPSGKDHPSEPSMGCRLSEGQGRAARAPPSWRAPTTFPEPLGGLDLGIDRHAGLVRCGPQAGSRISARRGDHVVGQPVTEHDRRLARPALPVSLRQRAEDGAELVLIRFLRDRDCRKPARAPAGAFDGVRLREVAHDAHHRRPAGQRESLGTSRPSRGQRGLPPGQITAEVIAAEFPNLGNRVTAPLWRLKPTSWRF